VSHLLQEVMQVIDSLDREEWMLVLVGVIVVGFLSLRGFGSRSRY